MSRPFRLARAIALGCAIVTGFIIACAGLPAYASGISDTASSTMWVTDSDVYSIAADTTHGVTYIGGRFDYVGPQTGAGAPFSTTTGAVAQSFPQIVGNGDIEAVVSDGAGGWYVGGDFSVASGGDTLTNLIHIKSDDTLDAAFAPNPNGEIHSLALSPDDSTLYVGGGFTAIGGSGDYPDLAAISTSDDSFKAWSPAPNGVVYALAVSPDGSTLYAGGEFSSMSGQSRGHLASFSASDGSITEWNPDTDGYVYALAVSPDDSTVYVGGDFQNMGNGATNRSYLASFDRTNGDALTDWDPEPDEDIYVLAVSPDDSTVYVGGDFDHIGEHDRNFIAAVDASTGDTTSWDPEASSDVNALAVSADGSTVYVGGAFGNIGGGSCRGTAGIDAETGEVGSFCLNAGDSTNALAFSGGALYVGGIFNSIGGVSRENLAAIDSSTGEATSWDPEVDGDVNALALSPDDSTVYVGGTFDQVGDDTRNDLASFDTGTSDLTSWNPDADSDVGALAVSTSTVYAGGAFNTVNGGVSRSNLASFNTTDGTATDWNPGPDEPVTSLLLSPDGSTLYAGGDFTNIGENTRSYLASFNTTDGTATDWNPGPDEPVTSLLLSPDGSTLYFGGYFDQVGDESRSNLASVHASTGVLNDWDPSPDDGVDTLLLSGDTLYAGGTFDQVGDDARSFLASFDTSTGDLTSWDPEADANVYALALNGSTLYAGGAFSNIGDAPRVYLAAFTGAGGDTTAPTPGASGAISASNISPTDLILSWTKATDDTSAQSALQYRVYQSSSNNLSSVSDAEANGTELETASDIDTFDVSGLSADTMYYFTVIVADFAGNIAAYQVQTATTTAVQSGGEAEETARAAEEME